MAVGEWRDSEDLPGAAYVFGRTGASQGGWRELARLAPDGLTEEDHFGVSVAVEGDTVVVGADQDRQFIPEHGAVYVFRELEESPAISVSGSVP